MTKRIIGNFERGLLAGMAVVILVMAVFIHIQAGGQWIEWVQPHAVLSFLGMLIGFIFLHWQLELQSENTLRANRQQAADKLRLEIYDKVANRIEATRAPLAKLVNAPRLYVISLKDLVRSGARPDNLPERLFPKHDLMDTVTEVSETIFPLLAVIENYEIALSDFALFKSRLAEQLSAVSESASAFFFATVPYQRRDGFGPSQWPPDISLLDEGADKVLATGLDLVGTVEDLRVEAQNHLVSPLFGGKKAARRQPADPSVEVLSLPGSVDTTDR